tara:strand:+ start:145 stop:546 length:402 start_codon:yes stop_codon:yes gene_type:complete
MTLKINNLKDLNKLRTAPHLSEMKAEILFIELEKYIKEANWFTVGIMAPSTKTAIKVIRDLEKCFKWKKMKIITEPNQNGAVFLKANMKSGSIYIRNEQGLGEGILLTGHKDDIEESLNTIGPFPLNFFQKRT